MASCVALTLTLLQIVLLLQLDKVSAADQNVSSLIRDMFSDYNRLVRPVKNSSDPIIVDFYFYFAHVLDMNEREQTLSSSIWLTLFWQDDYMTWDPDDYGGVYMFKVPSKEVWLPDIYFYQNAELQTKNFLQGSMVKVFSEGKIMWGAPVNFKGYCLLDVRYFPFDHQVCEMKFGPWQHNGKEIIMMGKGDKSVFNSNGEWDMTGINTSNNVEYYPDDPGIPFTDCKFTIMFTRRSEFYVFNLMMPSCLICLMAALAFLLPPTSQGKVNLGVTFLLSMTVFLMIVAESIPPTNQVPVIGQYFAATMMLVSLSLVLNVCVVAIFSHATTGEPVPECIRTCVLGVLSAVVRLSSEEIREIRRQKFKRSGHKHRVLTGPSFSGRTKFTSVPMKEEVRSHGVNYYMDYVPNSHMSNNNDKSKRHSEQFEALTRELKRMNETLTGMKLGDKKFSTDQRRNYREWVLVSRVLDRTFLVLYLIGNVMSVLLLVLPVMIIKPDVPTDQSEDV
ncbi:neuronal acetylcholine receptor subunit alpha-10-like isoform X1 [Acanthaster planci]|uniref:Neuronal acetylcholine receptor subunit alpha-10-like isoform X1 n=1 Tax=Acanthaster planci TaxID=133434 RepID=A0A8B7YEL2_ACAPL|nr:neuronal acetylcholine receptor subunit alpha-10-like isoform X1 [Acanthaster planci]